MAMLTDDEWRAFQKIPDQGYSHRAWIDARIRERMESSWDEGYEAAERDNARANSNSWHTDECDCLVPTRNPYEEN
jgi:hypothetical protein